MQHDRQDKSAAGWDHIEKVEKHDSQRGAEGLFIIHSSDDLFCAVNLCLHCICVSYVFFPRKLFVIQNHLIKHKQRNKAKISIRKYYVV